eukprot:TRINITY_DN24883_c0_g1_i4.p1 TRINITY_DN24883_c0_g1~~TRINITY_DN24883_c0_g1_i4.p1  ORF type:complete len:305 (+),score=62.74 TRINITY_DN24883_c0_g1_i4:231-1145(+)
MFSLLTREPRIGLDDPPMESMPDPAKLEWTITFENVAFEYPQRPGAAVLQGLSFVAQANEFLGILGATGAGKSTVFLLLLRFYEPTSGRILLDGKDLKQYNPLWLRLHMGIYSQEFVLSRKSIRENLFYGCAIADEHSADTSERGMCAFTGLPKRSEEEAKDALRQAQCLETFFDATSFPNLWHTAVGNGGDSLSSGQKQRLGIARALLKRPRLLLLDEATSAVDEQTQAKLQEEIVRLRKQEGTTVICIAHRLSNFAKADRLVVLENGCSVEEGTPAELMARPDGKFAEYAKTHRDSLPGAAE